MTTPEEDAATLEKIKLRKLSLEVGNISRLEGGRADPCLRPLRGQAAVLEADRGDLSAT